MQLGKGKVPSINKMDMGGGGETSFQNRQLKIEQGEIWHHRLGDSMATEPANQCRVKHQHRDFQCWAV